MITEEQQLKWFNDLKQEFGSSLGHKAEMAKMAVNTLGGQELRDTLNQTGLGNNPTLFKLFIKLANNIIDYPSEKEEYRELVNLTIQSMLSVHNELNS
jgi:hypothetical protein